MDDQPAAPAVAPPAGPTRKSTEILKSTDFYVMVGVLAGVLLLAALAISIVDRWRRRGDRGTSSPLTLSSFREMYENGEITQKEYERIREKMAAKMKKEVGLKPPAANTDPPPPDGPVGRDDTPPPADPPAAR